MKTWCFLGVIVFSYFSCFGQSGIIDSLKRRLPSLKPDSNKAVMLTVLSRYLLEINDFKGSLNYSDEAIKLSKTLGYQRGLAMAFQNIGPVYQYQSDYAKALDYYFRALGIWEKLKDEKGIALQLGNIGVVYYSQHNYSRAHTFYIRALEIYERIQDKQGVATQLCNIGIVFDGQHNYFKSLDYYYKALRNFEELGDKKSICSLMLNIGNVYADRGDSLANAGNGALAAKEMYPPAIKFYFKALEISKEIKDKNGIANFSYNIGELYTILKKNREAEAYLLKAIAVSGDAGFQSIADAAAQSLSKLYEQAGKYDLALKYYKSHIAKRDSIFNEENTKKQVQVEMNYEFEKKEAAAKLEQEKKEAVAVAESKKQKIVIWSVCGILMLVIIFAVFAYRSYLQKRKANIEITRQKEIIEEKQKEILDSIHYAKRIQTALLTSPAYIERNLKKLQKS